MVKIVWRNTRGAIVDIQNSPTWLEWQKDWVRYEINKWLNRHIYRISAYGQRPSIKELIIRKMR